MSKRTRAGQQIINGLNDIRQGRIQESVAAYRKIMADPIKRAEYEKELILWDETVGDGIIDEDQNNLQSGD